MSDTKPEIIVIEERARAEPKAQVPVPAAEGGALMQIISRAASDPAYDVEKLKALLAVKREWEQDEARKAFVVALNAFKAAPPQVLKDKTVSFGAGKTAYKHAGLDTTSELIGAALATHGISHRWDVKQEGANISVTCILTHALGHSEQVSMTAQADSSGSKNSIQAVGSTVSYLQRYTLFAASGIAPKNVDDDGRGGGALAMDEKEKTDWMAKLTEAAKVKEAEALWAEIAARCSKLGCVTEYDELKKAAWARIKDLKKSEATI